MPDDIEKQIEQRPEYAWLRDPAKMWYTVGEVATGLGFSPNTVRRMCERGDIPGARLHVGSEWRVPRSGVIEYLKRNTSGGASSQAV
jgi:excisionase family DNA binding protein